MGMQFSWKILGGGIRLLSVRVYLLTSSPDPPFQLPFFLYTLSLVARNYGNYQAPRLPTASVPPFTYVKLLLPS